MAIKNVVVAGVTGNLGPPILKALVAAGTFNITIFSRPKQATAPAPALAPPSATNGTASPQTVEVDYTSIPSLTTTLSHLHADCILSLLPHTASQTQTNLIHASVAAGVPRFIPSEFGADLDNPVNRAAPTYRGKVGVQELLKTLAAENQITYTIVYNGAFLDWGLAHSFPVDVGRREAVLHGGGERVYSTTTQTSIGKAVVSILQREEESRNRVVRIAEANLTIKHLLGLAQEVIGGEGWTITETDVEAEVAKAWPLIKQGVFNRETMMPFIHRAQWGVGTGGHFEENDNAWLGVQELDDEGVRAVIRDEIENVAWEDEIENVAWERRLRMLLGEDEIENAAGRTLDENENVALEDKIGEDRLDQDSLAFGTGRGPARWLHY
ncbi:aromatic alcohol reductase [Aspergillus mulundensis]|uniref:NmrA-like domain-containing protein n=1 Tax=Aspergillus mulundensis TaxID=1810919 RepID=A0A3D8QH78_9EURO|nr:hypothetical protein DSM5745_10627 [Aspergillus mulundensis]RDW61129.1 hypothetical protein DSM5745_10627 [Aspergillus mulundensis]